MAEKLFPQSLGQSLHKDPAQMLFTSRVQAMKFGAQRKENENKLN
jgi:hypothetical protein